MHYFLARLKGNKEEVESGTVSLFSNTRALVCLNIITTDEKKAFYCTTLVQWLSHCKGLMLSQKGNVVNQVVGFLILFRIRLLNIILPKMFVSNSNLFALFKF